MISQGCSIDNQNKTSFEFPMCVILTHRRGACVGVFTDEASILYPSEMKLQQRCDEIEFFKHENSFICARTLGKTAENLAHLFQFAINELYPSQMKLQPRIQSFIVGIGPGSFTGLRLGCAFVNGLHLASETSLYSVQTTPVHDISELVTFDDLFSVLQKIAEGDIVKCPSLVPDYNKISA